MEQFGAYIRDKVRKVTPSWSELDVDDFRHVFTIPTVDSEEELEAAQEVVAEAIEGGYAFSKAAKQLAAVLRSTGWTHKSPEIETILNIYTGLAYGDARRERQVKNRENRPYWQYSAKMDNQTHPDCAARDGQVWHADDLIWDTIYPPNRLNCRCMVRALSARDIEREGPPVNRRSQSWCPICHRVDEDQRQDVKPPRAVVHVCPDCPGQQPSIDPKTGKPIWVPGAWS